MKKIMKIIFCFSLLFILTGCWDKQEMEDRGYVITMGIDAAEDDEGYQISFGVAQLSTLSTQGGNNGGEDAPPLVIAQGESLASAMREGNCRTSRQLYLGQCKTIVFGKDLLENKELLQGVLEELERNQNISPKTMVLGTNGKAEKLVGQMLLEDGSTGMYLWNFYKTTADHLAVTERLCLEEFLGELADRNGKAILPLVSLTEKEINLGGGLFLWDYLLVKELSSVEEQNFSFLEGEGEGAVLEERWEGNIVPLLISDSRCKVSFYGEKEGIICYIRPVLSGRIEGSGTLFKTVFSLKTRQELEHIFAKKVERELLVTLEKLREDGDGSLEEAYRREFHKEPPPFSIEVQAKVNIEGVGIIE